MSTQSEQLNKNNEDDKALEKEDAAANTATNNETEPEVDGRKGGGGVKT
ncbi:hypothetical protein Q4489_04175 [Thalassotalea sp. 1_MG-2023]|nr:hypothetical protein [Thalassotalea sp. 1_MG-2023]MDO6426193.1 hypothetical protein [Thalassotalea sp. 1_MG-2023]